MISTTKIPPVSLLVKASRPRTLIASLSPMLLGTVMAYSSGAFTFWVFAFTLLTGLGIQISTNFANDLFDFLKGADTSNRKGPVRVTQSGLMSVEEMKWATIAIMSLTALAGCVLIFQGGLYVAALLPLALLLAVGYTTGPFPLAYLGIAEIFILLFFGPIASGMTYYLQTLTFERNSFLIGFSPGLLSCSLLIINNLRDVAEDKIASKKTLVVRFGAFFGKCEYSICIATALFLPFLLVKKPSLLYLLFLIPGWFLIRSVWKIKTPAQYNPMLANTGRLLTLYTFIFCLSILL